MGCCGSRYRITASSIFDEVRGNVDGRTILITGASSGIGYETARVLALHGAHLVVPARDERKSAELIRRLREETKNDHITGGILELGSLQSVRSFAQSFIATNQPLHILINNAGIMAPPFGKTVDGFELQMGTNHFGHFFLTQLLLPVLRRSSPSRVVNLSSDLHNRSGAFKFDILASGPSESDYSGFGQYAQSKLANVYFTTELARREKANGITAYVLHPGVIRTNLTRSHSCSGCAFGCVSCCLKTIPQGAATTVYCAVAPGIEDKSGSYFMNAGVGVASRDANNHDAAARLWEISLRLIDERCPASGIPISTGATGASGSGYGSTGVTVTVAPTTAAAPTGSFVASS